MQLHCRAQTQSSLAATAEAPTPIEIDTFRSALEQLLQNRGSDEPAVVDMLLDFFTSRCLVAGEMRQLGATLFSALNASTAQAVTLGCFDERFQFRRLEEKLSVFVDDKRLATILVQDALVLEGLMRGRTDHSQAFRQICNEETSAKAIEC